MYLCVNQQFTASKITLSSLPPLSQQFVHFSAAAALLTHLTAPMVPMEGHLTGPSLRAISDLNVHNLTPVVRITNSHTLGPARTFFLRKLTDTLEKVSGKTRALLWPLVVSILRSTAQMGMEGAPIQTRRARSGWPMQFEYRANSVGLI